MYSFYWVEFITLAEIYDSFYCLKTEPNETGERCSKDSAARHFKAESHFHASLAVGESNLDQLDLFTVGIGFGLAISQSVKRPNQDL